MILLNIILKPASSTLQNYELNFIHLQLSICAIYQLGVLSLHDQKTIVEYFLNLSCIECPNEVQTFKPRCLLQIKLFRKYKKKQIINKIKTCIKQYFLLFYSYYWLLGQITCVNQILKIILNYKNVFKICRKHVLTEFRGKQVFNEINQNS